MAQCHKGTEKCGYQAADPESWSNYGATILSVTWFPYTNKFHINLLGKYN